jgi:hypothetical protein
MRNRTAPAASVLVAACLLAVPTVANAADEGLKPPLELSAIVTLEGGFSSGTRQIGVVFRIDRLTPRDDVWAHTRLLASGQGALRAAIEGRSDGLMRLGALDFPVNLAVSRRDGDIQSFVLVSARALRVSEVNLGMETTDYPFGVAAFTVDGMGRGGGLVYPAARISLDENGSVVIENYQEKPGILSEIRLKR